MPHYRLYMLDAQHHIRHAHDLDCPDDGAAVTAIREHHLPTPMELWCGKRLVRRFPVEPLGSARGDLGERPDGKDGGREQGVHRYPAGVYQPVA